MRPSEIEALLPGVFHRTLEDGAPLRALVEVMSALHAPAEAALEQVEVQFNPRRARADFVPFLARWVNLELTVPPRHGRLRELVAIAFELSQWRGTARGLLAFLETASGERGFVLDERVPDDSGSLRPFHVRVRAPAVVASQRPMLEEIIEREKPAHVTFELTFDAPKTETPHASRV